MPSAYDETRDFIIKLFGSLDPGKPQEVLELLGWKKEKKLYLFTKPPREITEFEDKLANFLFWEWDYGFTG